MQPLLSQLVRSTKAVPGCACTRLVTSFRSLSGTSSFRSESKAPFLKLAIYVSKSHDPHFNLAYEDWLFRKTDSSIITLYMYRNTPSIIIGRNQNPWKEIDLHRSEHLGIPFVRRKSGGGTVYHDLGNTNYCVFVPRLEFERRTNAELVARALNNLGIEAYVNERNDICVDSFKMSRSAFKLVNARAYHHGTMLIDAKLKDLKGLLENSRDTLVTKGVASVPSPVKNLREFSATIDHASFVRAVTKEFGKSHGDEGIKIHEVDESEVERNDYARGVIDELQSWDWKYGQTPEFTHDVSGEFPFGPLAYHITSRHALITSCTITTSPSNADYYRAAQTVREIVQDLRYGSLDGVEGKIPQGLKGKRVEELLKWLRGVM
ncbi:BZ3500_MvSof-1268-A1-R1_Chr5-3g08153 [Microbotryum saponariae]|uniref:Putative lipoate-protein ligase A n=1 Tax=Microbotryum saponariae TaxID=289078 RepID=A0A2X0NIV6_9BASI|nr:BZ3500_MvSof-1268-A1-R1_Chr5-3g08153 [Microbotryum saponariae]SDA07912.1 BZ3501_MvSof-1269-A2-R1_Chr5-1g07297 [Microbotryum saponariae]